MDKSFTLREAVAADVESLVEIYFSAFKADAISLLAFPRNNEAVVKFWIDMLSNQIASSDSKFVLITAGDTIISWAQWVQPTHKEISTSLPEWPRGSDVALANHFFGNLFERRKKIMGDRQHWYLELLATTPEWQGKGAAGKLLRWGLNKADATGLEAYVEASPAGKSIYEYFGFEEVERLVVSLEGKGHSGTGETHDETEFVEVMMLRPARKI